MAAIQDLNDRIPNVSDEGKRWTSWLGQILTILLSGGMLLLSIIQIYNNDEDKKLNPFNPQQKGREYSKLSGLFFALVPLLTAKVLYHIYLLIDSNKSSDKPEKEKFKTLRHVIGIAILVAAAGVVGLAVHPSPDYCFDQNHPKQVGAVLKNVNASAPLSNGDRIDPKHDLVKCSIKDLKLVTKETKGNVTSITDTERYGEPIVESTELLLIGAVLLRVLGGFLDHGDAKKVISWADPKNISLLKYVILLSASLISVIAVNIAKDEDLLEKGKDGKQLIEDLVFLDVFIGFAWAHFILLAAGVVLKFVELSGNLENLKIALINNIPLVRLLIVTGTLLAVAYTIGTAAILFVDYSFLSLALVSLVVLDVFGRNKEEEIA